MGTKDCKSTEHKTVPKVRLLVGVDPRHEGGPAPGLRGKADTASCSEYQYKIHNHKERLLFGSYKCLLPSHSAFIWALDIIY